jgi:hypothetical protein
MDKSDKEYWKDFLNRYRLSKKVRNLKDKFNFKELSELTGFSKQFIYGIQEMTIKPNEDFIKKLERIVEL